MALLGSLRFIILSHIISHKNYKESYKNENKNFPSHFPFVLKASSYHHIPRCNAQSFAIQCYPYDHLIVDSYGGCVLKCIKCKNYIGRL